MLQSQNIHIHHTHTQTSIKQYTRIKFSNRLQKNPGDPPEKVNRAKYRVCICSSIFVHKPSTHLRYFTFIYGSILYQNNDAVSYLNQYSNKSPIMQYLKPDIKYIHVFLLRITHMRLFQPLCYACCSRLVEALPERIWVRLWILEAGAGIRLPLPSPRALDSDMSAVVFAIAVLTVFPKGIEKNKHLF